MIRFSQFMTEGADATLADKAKKSGFSLPILKQVYKRGMAAWKVGHKPGTTPQQWGMARVNSFITGGRTRVKGDPDLWAKQKGKIRKQKMPLKVSDGIGAWIDDFKKSDAPQFKGKSDKERRDQAIAAYLSAKRGDKQENVKSADRKPEVYTKPDGKRGVRMVPVDREVIKKESVDELSMYTSKKLPNLSYPKKKTKYQQEKDRINMMKKNKQKGESVNEISDTLKMKYRDKAKDTMRLKRAQLKSISKSAYAGATDKEKERASKRADSIMTSIRLRSRPKGESVEEKYTDRQRIMRDMGRNQPSDPSGALKKKISQDARNISKYMKGSPVRPKDLARRATGGEGGHEMERGIKKRKVGGAKNPDYAPVSQDKLARKSEGMKEEMNFAVSIDGLPTMFMSADSPGMLKQTLRKIVKQPSMIQNVKRVTDAQVKKTFRLKAQGREEEQDESVNELSYKTMNQYAKKSKADTDRATNSAVATILRKGDHSKDLNTMRKREKGIKLAKSRITDKIRKGQKS